MKSANTLHHVSWLDGASRTRRRRRGRRGRPSHEYTPRRTTRPGAVLSELYGSTRGGLSTTRTTDPAWRPRPAALARPANQWRHASGRREPERSGRLGGGDRGEREEADIRLSGFGSDPMRDVSVPLTLPCAIHRHAGSLWSSEDFSCTMMGLWRHRRTNSGPSRASNSVAGLTGTVIGTTLQQYERWNAKPLTRS
jgi:hypothetical protein